MKHHRLNFKLDLVKNSFFKFCNCSSSFLQSHVFHFSWPRTRFLRPAAARGAGSVWHKIFNINSVLSGLLGDSPSRLFSLRLLFVSSMLRFLLLGPEEEQRFYSSVNEKLRVWSDCDMTGSSCWIRPVNTADTGQSVQSAPLQIKSLKFSRILVLFIHVESNLLARPYARHRTVMQTGCSRASVGLKGQMLIFMLTSRRRIHRLHMQTEVCWLWTGGLKQQPKRFHLQGRVS